MQSPGETKLVTFILADRWLSSWDVSTHLFKLQKGEFGVMIGGASDAIQLTGTMTV